MSDESKSPRQVAVALQYDQQSDQAPRVVAKGRGLIAEKIIALAQENDVVIEANPALAEALSSVELDDTIPIELYEAVAIIIGFVMRQGRPVETEARDPENNV